MSKIEQRVELPPIDLEQIIYKARAVDLLRSTLSAFGDEGEYWCKDAARSNDRRCLAQMMFDVAEIHNSGGDFPTTNRPVMNLAVYALLCNSANTRDTDDDAVPVDGGDIVAFNDHPHTNFDVIKGAITNAICVLSK